MRHFRAKQVTYLNTDTCTLFSCWHPQIKVGGCWCFLSDDKTRTLLKEADSEEDATIMAIEELRKVLEDTQEDKP